LCAAKVNDDILLFFQAGRQDILKSIVHRYPFTDFVNGMS